MAGGISSGLALMHSKNIIHRDIKSQNILITGEGKIKICDMGVSKYSEQKDAAMTLIGTPHYMAPEVIVVNKRKAKPYTSLSDIWSLAATIYELATGSPRNFSFLIEINFTLSDYINIRFLMLISVWLNKKFKN